MVWKFLFIGAAFFLVLQQALSLFLAFPPSTTLPKLLTNYSSPIGSVAFSEVRRIEVEGFVNCHHTDNNCQFHPLFLTNLSYPNLETTFKKFLHRPPPSQQQQQRVVLIGLEFPRDAFDLNPLDSLNSLTRFISEHPLLDLIYADFTGTTSRSSLIFRLLPDHLAHYLTSLASHYFPSGGEETCRLSPLSVNLDAGGTWGNRVIALGNHQRDFPQSIFTVFLTSHCQHQSTGTRFGNPFTCPDEIVVNKFECIFLPVPCQRFSWIVPS